MHHSISFITVERNKRRSLQVKLNSSDLHKCLTTTIGKEDETKELAKTPLAPTLKQSDIPIE